jgi:SecD/SecF fusion protein
MCGLICGAYSSVCVTGPLWYMFKTKAGKNEKNAGAKKQSGKKTKKA